MLSYYFHFQTSKLKITVACREKMEKDFLDLDDDGLTDEWPEFLIEWIFGNTLGEQQLESTVYKSLIFRDRKALETMIRAEYKHRRLHDEKYSNFESDWNTARDLADRSRAVDRPNYKIEF